MSIIEGVPHRASNRRLNRQLELWGAKVHKANGEWTTYKLLTGEQHKVRPDSFSQGTSRITIKEAIKDLGLTEQEFWARTEPVNPPTKKKAKEAPVPTDVIDPETPALAVQREREGIDPRLLEAAEMERKIRDLREAAYTETTELMEAEVNDLIAMIPNLRPGGAREDIHVALQAVLTHLHTIDRPVHEESPS